jgi:AcrR family transcriptional regulator
VEADDAVLAAALDLIAESGVEGVSIEQAAHHRLPPVRDP